MYSSVKFLVAVSTLVISDGSSITYQYDDIVSKTKVELSPVHITTSLNEIIIISSPIVNCKNAEYQLRRPNGDIIRTESSSLKNGLLHTNLQDDSYESKVVFKYINKDIKAMYPSRMYKQPNLRNDYDWAYEESNDVVKMEESKMNSNDFMIGPLLEEDHGNWVLSVYCKDIDGEWVEMFQVITVEIRTYVEMVQARATLTEGSTFNLSFLYPIKNLETCELTVPKSAADRFYDRSRIELDRCGYVITNITKKDEGTWRVTGVGRIVYEGVVRLNLDDPQENKLRNLYY